MRKKQKIDIKGLYKRNALEVFQFSTLCVDEASCVTVPMFTPLLPVTMTLGAGVGTLFQIHKRKPLMMENLNNAIQKLRMMDGCQVYQVATELLKFEPSYGDSSRFIKQLSAFNNHIVNLILLKKKAKQREMIFAQDDILVSETCFTHKKSPSKKYVTFTLDKQNYLLPVLFYEDMNAKVENYLNNDVKPQIFNEARSQIILLIFDYLTNRINAGDKLQHFILDNIVKMNMEIENKHKVS